MGSNSTSGSIFRKKKFVRRKEKQTKEMKDFNQSTIHFVSKTFRFVFYFKIRIPHVCWAILILKLNTIQTVLGKKWIVGLLKSFIFSVCLSFLLTKSLKQTISNSRTQNMHTASNVLVKFVVYLMTHVSRHPEQQLKPSFYRSQNQQQT